MRAGVLVVVAVVAGCSRSRGVPCDGVLAPGELCDDGNEADGDGCDCTTRAITPAQQPLVPGVPSVITEDGAWCWFSDERVLVDHDKVVVSSISHGGDIQVTALDPPTGQRTHGTLYARLERDDHDVASLLRLPDGRLAAFFTRHDGFEQVFARETASPDDVSAWTPLHVTHFPYDVAYTNPFLLASRPDRTFMFVRGIDTNPTMLASSDLGYHWTDGAQLLDAGERQITGLVFDHRPYVKYASNDADEVHLLYTDGHPVEFGRNSIYHLVYREDALWRSDGARVTSAKPDDQPLLEPERGTLVYDGRVLPGGQAWMWDAQLDAEGRPVVAFSTFPDPSRPFYDHRYRYARWDGTTWHVHTIGYGGTGIYAAEGYYSGGITLDPDAPNVVYFASNVQPTTGEPAPRAIFEIYRGVTSDGGATWSITPVTSGSQVHNLRPIVPASHAEATTLLWMRGSYETYLDFRTQIVALIGAADITASTPPTAPTDLVALARFDLAATVNGPATPTAPGFVAAVPAGGYAFAESGGISLVVSNITGTREVMIAEPLYRGTVICDRGGYSPSNKLRVEVAGLLPEAEYVIRIHGYDLANAYTKPTLWFRGDARNLDSDQNAAFLTGHRNVNTTAAGEGFTDLRLRSNASGRIELVARGLDYAGDDRTAVLSGLEVLRAPVVTLVARFDIDAAPDLNTAPGAASISFDDTLEWSGEATSNAITMRVTSDRIEALRVRASDNPLLADFIYGRDQLVVDLSGLEVGRLYAITVYSTDLEHNLYAASRWRVDEPGHAPVVVHGFHMNLHRSDDGASFTFYHRAATSSLRLRGEDVITSLSSNPSVVILNGVDVSVAP